MRLELEPLATHTVADEHALALFLDQLEHQLEQVSRLYSEMAFVQYQTRQRPVDMERVEAAQADLLNNPEYQELIARWAGKVTEPLLARRVQLWEQAFRSARVSVRPDIRHLVNEISDTIVQYRYQVQGQELDLGAVRKLLRTEPDRERRRAAWESFAPLSRALEEKTRELFRRRNAAARREGFETYAHMQLDAQGLSLEQVKAILEELAHASDPAYRRLLASAAAQAGLDRVEPWDIKYLLDGQSSLPARHFPRDQILPRLQEWGQIHGCDMAQLGISVHFMDIPYNGLCMTMHPRDIRILGNPADGHNYYKTAFHELGHALHSAYNNPGSYILRREPSVFSEGMAEMLGYTVQDPAWLAHMGLSPTEVEAAGSQAMGPWFAYLRQRSAHALFEYQAYADPEGDLDRINAEVEARLLGCTLNETPRWASEPNAWYSRYPVYWQNYVLADVVASQVHHDLRRRFGSVWCNPEAVAFIRERYWAPGGSVDWQEKLRLGTGEGLSTKALVADLAGE